MVGNAILILAVLFVGIMTIPAYAESSPREQLKDGIPINQIQCGEEKTLMQSAAGKPACVFDASLEILLVQGWSIIQVEPTPEPQGISDIIKLLDPLAEGLQFWREWMVKLDTPAEPQAEFFPENDIMYLLADGHITTKYAPKLPDPDAVWFPMSVADAEILMQRMAKANDDKIIFKNCLLFSCITSDDCCIPEEGINISRLSFETNVHYLYDTEKGNHISLIKKHASLAANSDINAPHVIDSIVYSIWEDIPHDQRGAFTISFMEKAGFHNSVISDPLSDNFIVYGGIKSVLVSDYPDPVDSIFQIVIPFTKITFTGWTNNAESLYQLLLNETELERRAHEFAKKHIHLISPELCESFEEEPLRGYSDQIDVFAGTMFNTITVGHCVSPYGSWHVVDVTIEALEGKIAFFREPLHLVENWYERIDIPEYALTHLQSKIQEQLGAAKSVPTIKPITVTSTKDLFESRYHENGSLIDEKWYHENGNPKTQKKYNLLGNGNLKQETHYYDDNGFIKSDKKWNENGQLSSEGEWNEDGKTNFQRHWYDNGELSSEIIWTYSENWKPQSHLSKIYYENGNLNIESKKVGSPNHDKMIPEYYRHYHENGELNYDEH